MEATTPTSQSLYEGYKAQEKTPTWKVVAAVAFLAITTVALVLLLVSPLSPVAFPLSIALKPLIIGAGGIVFGTLVTGSICVAKNGCENALLEDLCEEGAKNGVSCEYFNGKINTLRTTHGQLPTVEEFKASIQEAKNHLTLRDLTHPIPEKIVNKHDPKSPNFQERYKESKQLIGLEETPPFSKVTAKDDEDDKDPFLSEFTENLKCIYKDHENEKKRNEERIKKSGSSPTPYSSAT